MIPSLRLTLALTLLVATPLSMFGQTLPAASQKESTASAATPSESSLPVRRTNADDDKKSGKTAITETSTAPTVAPDPAIADPLLRVLVSKGVLSAEDVRVVSSSGTPAEQRNALASLLHSKGIISDTEYEALHTVTGSMVAVTDTIPQTQGTGQQTQNNQKPVGPATAPQPAAPGVIAAIAPIRALQFDPPKRDGLVPDIKLGSGAKIKLYGFFKASLVHDSSSPGGNDFPLPGFLNDTGPDNSPEFHIKARSFRLGANFEWLDPAPKTTITGRLEFDFEGNFSRVNNRNISSIRSSMPSIRLAWMRIDRRFGEKTTGFALFGQDWTPFGSSTLPNLIETTGLGIGYGTLYERAPQARFGVNYKVGGKRALSFQPEFALVLPAFGDLPTDLGNQLGFGERQGVDSNRPEFEGRFVTQFQLDKAKGVVPAQLIASFMQGRRTAIVTRAGVPLNTNTALGAANIFQAAFPSGAKVDSSRYGYTLEAQLPTRFVTLLAKYYNGSDLRFFFAGQLLSNFNDTAGLTGTATGTSIDGASTVVFGLQNGVAVIAPERSVRSQGGFINLGFPLSRIFDADPKGRAAGFTGYLHYGYDQANPRDARRFAGGAIRGKSDLFAGNLQYKLNTFVTFAFEESLYRTRAVNNGGTLPLFRGIPSRETHDVRSEFATIFTF